MTREEVKHVLEYIVGSGAMFRTPSMTDTINVWFDMLKEYSCKDVQEATRTALATNSTGFAPSVGQVIACIHVTENVGYLTESEAWDECLVGMRNRSKAIENFEKMNPLVQEAIGSSRVLEAWAMQENADIYQEKPFKERYREILRRKKEINKMPKNVRALIDATTKANTRQLATKDTEPIKLTDSTEKPVETGNTMPQWVADKLKEMKGE